MPLAGDTYAIVHVVSVNTKYTCDPFLVSVPDGNDLDAGAPALNVTIEPKFADNDTVTPPGDDTPGNPGSTAMTGANIAMIGMLAIAVNVAGFAIATIRRCGRAQASADGD